VCEGTWSRGGSRGVQSPLGSKYAQRVGERNEASLGYGQQHQGGDCRTFGVPRARNGAYGPWAARGPKSDTSRRGAPRARRLRWDLYAGPRQVPAKWPDRCAEAADSLPRGPRSTQAQGESACKARRVGLSRVWWHSTGGVRRTWRRTTRAVRACDPRCQCVLLPA
jgi:hypothetical protein